jgi:hypothetical protein
MEMWIGRGTWVAKLLWAHNFDGSEALQTSNGKLFVDLVKLNITTIL